MQVASLSRSAALLGIGLFFVACAETPPKGATPSAEEAAARTTACVGKCDGAGESSDGAFEFVVVGSGAGGGPLAANLARAGHKVLLLEAGEDTGGRLTYQVPAWHTLSTEDPAMRWDYFVDHYGDETQAAKDSKHTPEGVLYPRAGTLGGCTAHNAMITVYPHESDWDRIAEITGDESWRGANMRGYFQVLEKNKYLRSSESWEGHGTSGWLQTERANPMLGLRDTRILRIVTAGALSFVDDTESGLLDSLTGDFRELLGVVNRDLNTAAPGRDQTEGLFSIPLATRGARRNGTREYILDTAAAGFPLTVRTRALVTNLVYDEDDPTRVVGVEYLPGAHHYQADPAAKRDAPLGEKARVTVSGEVILSAGAFNTPQLLKLSGIGPADELERHGIPVRVNLPGVGENLQDRYEVGVVSEVDGDFKLLKDCTFDGKANDKCFVEWQRNGGGPYSSNGGVVGIVKRSSRATENPDLFIFGLPGYFKGYYPGYSRQSIASKRHFTWAVLKAHTKNKAGRVTLRSTDPRVRPAVSFNYFHEGSVENGEDWDDLNAVVDGVEFVRKLVKKTDDLMILGSFKEVFPGASVKSRAQIETFVKNEAWGHHASCTAKIGADDDPMAVLDTDFRVRGTTGLRVVDASVFPEIPGFFIVVPVYMISEKATDAILASLGESRWQ